ncbi:hypothetical protein [Veronia pacifica]|uniref:hypothetical protein n=1 Tax=Veronia pacifica TaxID=1080227 RepID=UPI001585E658|nr:hypothetical protein [Veronia pacifica]
MFQIEVFPFQVTPFTKSHAGENGKIENINKGYFDVTVRPEVLPGLISLAQFVEF